MSSDGVVYIVDDEEAVRRSIARLVRSVGLRAETFCSAQAFLARKASDEPACLVLDVRLPGQSGLDLQAAIGSSQRSMPIIFITGGGNVPMSVRAMKEGALDFLEKPFEARRCSSPSSARWRRAARDSKPRRSGRRSSAVWRPCLRASARCSPSWCKEC